MDSVRSLPLFENSNITNDYVDSKTIAAADGSYIYSREFDYDSYFRKSSGIILLYYELSGNASDTITTTIEFKYGGTTSWYTSAITLDSAIAANTSQKKHRLDITSTFRDFIPFDKIKFKFTKASANAVCPVKGRLNVL